MSVRRPILVGLLAGTVSLGAVPLAHAAFLNGATSSAAFSTASLTPPTGPVLTRSCSLNLLLVALTGRFTVSWAPTSTSWAKQEVVLRSAGVATQIVTVPAGVTTHTFEVALPTGSYNATVRATYENWTSATATSNTASC